MSAVPASPILHAPVELSPDPYAPFGDRWICRLPRGVRWWRLDDRLVARGWAPKTSAGQLLAYGLVGGHEVVIDPAARVARIRIALPAASTREARARVAAELAEALLAAAAA
jgi:hypothetical protein